MECRKMVLMTLFAGQQWRQMQRADLVWLGREGRVGCVGRVAWGHALPPVRSTANEGLLYATGDTNQSSVTA